IKHVTGIPHSPTGQAVIERTHRVLKDYLAKQKTKITDPVQRLHMVLFTLNYLCLTEGREEPPVIIHHSTIKVGRPQSLPNFYVKYRDSKTGMWEGP
ncbi:POK19 protein, partial [Callaeas wilsoni]|nr:POK19 protein [Callaeas wilsoni]